MNLPKLKYVCIARNQTVLCDYPNNRQTNYGIFTRDTLKNLVPMQSMTIDHKENKYMFNKYKDGMVFLTLTDKGYDGMEAFRMLGHLEETWKTSNSVKGLDLSKIGTYGLNEKFGGYLKDSFDIALYY